MPEITKEYLREYFDRPSVNEIEKKAGISKGYIWRILAGQKPLTQAVIDKLKPFIK